VTISHEAAEGEDFGPPPPAPGQESADDAGQSRITLRLPDHLKGRMESAAAAGGLSVNAWLVRAITAALESPGRGSRPRPAVGKRYTGFARS
jgi:hypothetical protein